MYIHVWVFSGNHGDGRKLAAVNSRVQWCHLSPRGGQPSLAVYMYLCSLVWQHNETDCDGSTLVELSCTRSWLAGLWQSVTESLQCAKAGPHWLSILHTHTHTHTILFTLLVACRLASRPHSGTTSRFSELVLCLSLSCSSSTVVSPCNQFISMATTHST